IEITAPKKINLSYSFYSGLIYYKTSHPVIKIQNDTTIFNFTENSIAEYVNDEENCPDDTLLYPSININFNTTFQNIAANYYERYFTKNLDEKTVNKLNEIIKDKKDNLEKVVSIYNYINRQIKLAGINLNENVYSPNETSRIIEASALNNLDKNYLFTKMVNYIGINAKMLFYKRNNKNGIIDKTPSLKQFDDVVTVVSVQNQDFIASFEDENYSFGQCDFDLINAECIDVSSKKSNTENIKNVNSKENQIITSYICKIYDDDSLEMEKTTAVKGIYQTDFRGKRFLSNEELSKWIKNRASNFGNDTSVIKYKFINNLNNFNEDVVLYENFLVKDYAISSGKNIKIFHLPGFNYSASKVNKNDRKFPFDLESISKNILNYEIIIPDSYKVKYIPKSEEFTNEYFTFKYNSNIIDNKILISIDLEYNKRVVPNNLYLELKKYMESLAKLSNEWFIFEKQ
ncbi:MAG TPA: hypothetical protein PK771_05690, partial [Spirochaetota bacterium]|nr:hypothetical protein [Spirochaetota bacterium]